jgi:hypothetical protein
MEKTVEESKITEMDKLYIEMKFNSYGLTQIGGVRRPRRTIT